VPRSAAAPLPAFAGAVLCGGASRRMGRDKALIALEGRALAVRVAEAVAAAGASGVVAVGGDLEGLRAAGLAAVPDRDGPGAGPLAGILTALTIHDRATSPSGSPGARGSAAGGVPGAPTRVPPEDAGGDGIVFVASCDLVTPSAEAVVAIVRALSARADADVAVPVVASRRQWMHAAWRRRAGAPLAAALSGGERAVHAAVAAGGLRVVDVDIDPAAVADADRPADLPPGRSAG
jgi:molybdenum cofactor guanylyltransferase